MLNNKDHLSTKLERHIRFMHEAFLMAEENAKNNFTTGGPFGAVIVLNDVIVGSGRNQVLENNDPTAHADIQAIRNACENLQTYDLTGCVLYTNCYPCQMCITAAKCANIKEYYWGNTKEDAAVLGFRDVGDSLVFSQVGREITIKTFMKFKEKNGIIY